jgi:hypothetical protein
VAALQKLTGQMTDPIRIGHVVNISANVVVPRGPGMGSHVAPSHQTCGELKMFWGPWVLNP